MNDPQHIPYDLRREPLLRAVTGSRLHGFAHPGSDHDAWHVVAEPKDHSLTLAARRIYQAIEKPEGGPVTDVTYVGLNTFLRYCAAGIPQALEALPAVPARPVNLTEGAA